jgi:hypothetical protein
LPIQVPTQGTSFPRIHDFSKIAQRVYEDLTFEYNVRNTKGLKPWWRTSIPAQCESERRAKGLPYNIAV